MLSFSLKNTFTSRGTHVRKSEEIVNILTQEWIASSEQAILLRLCRIRACKIQA
jgi:hypothetical protein